jgi:hypothetical protein
MGRPRKEVEQIENEEEDFEQEFEEIERETAQTPPRRQVPQFNQSSQVPQTQSPSINQRVQPMQRNALRQPQRQVVEEEKPVERYQAVYQPERVLIVDTITKEIISEGLPNIEVASLEAYKLNILDKLSIVSGA